MRWVVLVLCLLVVGLIAVSSLANTTSAGNGAVPCGQTDGNSQDIPCGPQATSTPTATPVPSPTPIPSMGSPVHGLTALWDCCNLNGVNVSASWYGQWVNYAGGSTQTEHKAVTDCPVGTSSPYAPTNTCIPFEYMDYMRNHYSGNAGQDVAFVNAMNTLALSNDSAFLHASVPPVSPSGCTASPYCKRLATSTSFDSCNPCFRPDPDSTNAQSWWNANIISLTGAASHNWYGVAEGQYTYSDDTEIYCLDATNGMGTSGAIYEYNNNNPGTACDSALVADETAFYNALQFPNTDAVKDFINGDVTTGICNSGTLNCIPLISAINTLIGSANVAGATCESCIVESGAATSIQVQQTAQVLDTASQFAGLSKLFILWYKPVTTDGSSTTCSSAGANCGNLQIRMYILALRLLNNPLYYADFHNGNNCSTCFNVYPEEQIMLQAPLTAMTRYTAQGSKNDSGCATPSGTVDNSATGGAQSIRRACGVTSSNVPIGVYVVEGTCYNYGTLIGNCASIVNATDAAVTISSLSPALTNTYTHSLTLGNANPGTVLGQCTLGSACPSSAVNPTGAAAPTSVAANSGLVLTP